MSKLKVSQEVSHKSTWLRHLKIFLATFLIGAGALFVSLIAFVTVKVIALGALLDI